ncbi:MAG: hypothetical protein M3O28_11700 [Actinomycetota bacterium]|nr:hypothetical protein [Actinomycetota bacterium]
MAVNPMPPPVVGQPTPDPQAQADALNAQAAQAQATADAAAARLVAARGDAQPLPPAIAADVVAVLPDVLAAIHDPSSLRKSGMAIVTAIVGVLASVGLIPTATDTVIVATAAVILPAIFLIVDSIHGHATATVQAAVIHAKGA